MIKRLNTLNGKNNPLIDRKGSLYVKKLKENKSEVTDNKLKLRGDKLIAITRLKINSSASGSLFLINSISVTDRKKDDTYRNYLIKTVKRLEFCAQAQKIF